MKRGYNSKRTYRVRCQSGLMGWRTRLRNNYSDFAEFARYDAAFSMSDRLGYGHSEAAWRGNPVVEGSVNPADYRKVS